MRRDAQRNREKLLAAAAEIFAERGLDVPLEEIARKAGVSIGTLYNRFPTRESLLDAILPGKVTVQLGAGEKALACDDPWEGFVTYMTSMCELQAGDLGLNDALSMRFPEAAVLEKICDEALRQAGQIIDRAQASGDLRPDFSADDLGWVLWANARIVQATADVAPDTWRRFLSFLLDGLRADAAHPIDVPALSADQVRAAMVRLSGRTGR